MPNLDGFDTKVKAELDKIEKRLKVEVRVELDDRSAQSGLDRLTRGLERRKVTVDVDADTTAATRAARDAAAGISGLDAQIKLDADIKGFQARRAEVLTQLQELRGADADVSVGADIAVAEAELAVIEEQIRVLDGRKATVKVDLDRRGVDTGLSVVTRSFEGLFSLGAKLPGVLGTVAGAFAGLFSTGTQAAGATGELVGGLGKVGTAGSSAAAGVLAIGAAAVVGFVKFAGFGAQASLVAAQLGAVTFAVGAVGAAVSALPALLFGAAAAGGAVALGIEGIKKAAEVAKPALDALKGQVSAVFTRELTPAFREVAALLPQLRGGFEGVAVSASGFIRSLLGVFTSTQGVRDLQAVLGNTRVLLDTMAPGVTTLVRTLLSIATVTPVFREIGLLVSGLSLQFAGLFARFAEGGENSLMVRAFTTLRQVLMAAVDAVGELVLGATEFFVNAGPGVTAALEGIGRIIGRIDFAGLGTTFGIFADAVVRFFDSIPQSTWDTLSSALREVALKFQELAGDPTIIAFFNALIFAIPVAVRTFADLLGAGRAVVNFFADAWQGAKLQFLQFADGVLQGVQIVLGGLASLLGSIPGVPAAWRDAAVSGVESIGQMRVGIGTEIGNTINDIKVRRPDAAAAGQGIGQGAVDGAKTGIAPIGGVMGFGAASAAEAVRGKGQAANAAGRGLGTGATDGARVGIAPLPGTMGAGAARAAESVRGQRGGFQSAGGDLSAGVSRGIEGGGSSVISAAVNIAAQAFAAAKRFLGIASPSKLFRDDVGAWIGPGMAVGIQAGTGKVEVASGKLGAAAVTGATKALARFNPADPARTLGLGDYTRDGLQSLLSGLTAQQAAAYRAGQSIGTQVGAGVRTGMDKSLDTYRPVNGGEFYADAVKASRIATIWSGGGDSGARGNGSDAALAEMIGGHVADALAGGIKLDTEAGEVIARLANAGNRSLDRR